jgi:hypothetical protein
MQRANLKKESKKIAQNKLHTTDSYTEPKQGMSNMPVDFKKLYPKTQESTGKKDSAKIIAMKKQPLNFARRQYILEELAVLVGCISAGLSGNVINSAVSKKKHAAYLLYPNEAEPVFSIAENFFKENLFNKKEFIKEHDFNWVEVNVGVVSARETFPSKKIEAGSNSSSSSMSVSKPDNEIFYAKFASNAMVELIVKEPVQKLFILISIKDEFKKTELIEEKLDALIILIASVMQGLENSANEEKNPESPILNLTILIGDTLQAYNVTGSDPNLVASKETDDKIEEEKIKYRQLGKKWREDAEPRFNRLKELANNILVNVAFLHWDDLLKEAQNSYHYTDFFKALSDSYEMGEESESKPNELWRNVNLKGNEKIKRDELVKIAESASEKKSENMVSKKQEKKHVDYKNELIGFSDHAQFSDYRHQQDWLIKCYKNQFDTSVGVPPIDIKKSNGISIGKPEKQLTYVINRTDLFEKLNDQLNKHHIVCCHGQGGIGKTSLVYTYCNEYSKLYSMQIWVDVGNPLKTFKELGQWLDLGINKKTTVSEIQKIVKSWLEKQLNILLIFDLDEKPDISTIDLYIPANCHVILISRKNIPSIKNINIAEFAIPDGFSAKQAMQYFNGILKEIAQPAEQQMALEKLAESFQYHPLALELTVAAIKGHGILPTDYLESEFEREEKIVGEQSSSQSFAHIVRIYEKSLKMIKGENTKNKEFSYYPVVELLAAMSFMAVNEIPVEPLFIWFQSFCYEYFLKKPTQYTSSKEFIQDEEVKVLFDHLLRCLQNFKLITRSQNEKNVSMHAIIAMAAHYSVDIDSSASSKSSPLVKDVLKNLAEFFLSNGNYFLIKTEKLTIIYPHLKSVTDFFEKKLSKPKNDYEPKLIKLLEDCSAAATVLAHTADNYKYLLKYQNYSKNYIDLKIKDHQECWITINIRLSQLSSSLCLFQEAEALLISLASDLGVPANGINPKELCLSANKRPQNNDNAFNLVFFYVALAQYFKKNMKINAAFDYYKAAQDCLERNNTEPSFHQETKLILNTIKTSIAWCHTALNEYEEAKLLANAIYNDYYLSIKDKISVFHPLEVISLLYELGMIYNHPLFSQEIMRAGEILHFTLELVDKNLNGNQILAQIWSELIYFYTINRELDKALMAAKTARKFYDLNAKDLPKTVLEAILTKTICVAQQMKNISLLKQCQKELTDLNCLPGDIAARIPGRNELFKLFSTINKHDGEPNVGEVKKDSDAIMKSMLISQLHQFPNSMPSLLPFINKDGALAKNNPALFKHFEDRQKSREVKFKHFKEILSGFDSDPNSNENVNRSTDFLAELFSDQFKQKKINSDAFRKAFKNIDDLDSLGNFLDNFGQLFPKDKEFCKFLPELLKEQANAKARTGSIDGEESRAYMNVLDLFKKKITSSEQEEQKHECEIVNTRQNNSDGSKSTHERLPYGAKDVGQVLRRASTARILNINDFEKWLKKYPTEINSQGQPSGDTPLHLAVENSHVDRVKSLLSYGSQHDIANSKDQTALGLAIKKNQDDVLNVFFEHIKIKLQSSNLILSSEEKQFVDDMCSKRNKRSMS